VALPSPWQETAGLGPIRICHGVRHHNPDPTFQIQASAKHCSFALFGWDAGVIGGLVGTPQFQKSINFTGDVPLIIFYVPGILLGDVVGCLLVVPFVYKIGRRLCVIWACVGISLPTSNVLDSGWV
jgi:hypothetical protein